MSYYKCPTCRINHANKIMPYEKELKAICENNKLNNEEKDTQKQKLLTDLELHRECCRSRMMGYIDETKIIK